MANSRQAGKRARQGKKRHCHNASRCTEMRTYIKRVFSAIQVGDNVKAITEYRLAVSVIDRLACRGIIHKNKAARSKRRLNAHIKAIVQAP